MDEDRESDSNASIGGELLRWLGRGEGGLYADEVEVKSRREDKETGVG